MFKHSSYRPRGRKNKDLRGLIVIIVALFVMVVGYFSAGGIIRLFGNLTKNVLKNNNNTVVSSGVSSQIEVSTINTGDLKGIYVPVSMLDTNEELNSIVAFAKKTEINTVVYDIKGEDGRLNFSSKIPLALQANISIEAPIDFTEINKKLKTANIYSIGRVVCFKDNFLPKFDSKYSVQISGGGKWWNTFFWTNPYNTEVTDYLYAIGEEVCAFGFNEIMLDEVKFPDFGRLELLNYGEPMKAVPKPTQLNNFVNTMAEKLHLKNVKLSLCIPGQGAYDEAVNAESGQSFDFAALKADYLSPRFQVSTLKNAYSTAATINDVVFEEADSKADLVVKASIEGTKKRMTASGSKFVLRPWVQDYDGSSKAFTAEDVKKQVDICKELKCGTFLAWNDKGIYKEEAYIKR